MDLGIDIFFEYLLSRLLGRLVVFISFAEVSIIVVPVIRDPTPATIERFMLVGMGLINPSDILEISCWFDVAITATFR
tara:strand:- start:5348 stop:5581 length:234 start_codon:yes stop_codon:yes gene_type:complete